MSGSSAAVIDHEALWRQTISILHPLKLQKWISPSRVAVSKGTTIRGGFGDVDQGVLSPPGFFEWILGTPARKVAVKSLRLVGDRNQRIRVLVSLARELNVWSKLDHQNILRMEGFYFDELYLNTAWIVTPWQSQGNLRTYLLELRPGKETRIKLALDVSRGLAYLHSFVPPMCHGDLKPENTLMDEDGNAILCDFGLSRILDENPSGLTTTLTPNYTPRYAAPELIFNGSHSLKSDVWAWGGLFLVIMTDRLPYSSSSNLLAMTSAVALGAPPAETDGLDIPTHFKRLLATCWDRDVNARPDMTTVIETIDPRFFHLERGSRASKWKSGSGVWRALRNPESDINPVVDIEGILYASGGALVNHASTFALTSDGGSVLYARDATTIAAFNLATDRAIREVDRVHKDEKILDFALSNDNKKVAILHRSPDDPEHRQICVGNWRQNIPQRRSSIHIEQEFPVESITWSSNDKYIVGRMRMSVLVWTVDGPAGMNVSSVEWDGAPQVGLQQPTTHLLATSRRYSLAVAVASNETYIFNIGTHRLILTISEASSDAFFTEDWNYLITGNQTGFKIWDIRPVVQDPSEGVLHLIQEAVWPLFPPAGEPKRMVFASIGSPTSLLAMSVFGSGLLLWDVEARIPVLKMFGQVVTQLSWMRFQPGSNFAKGTLIFQTELSDPDRPLFALQRLKYEFRK